MRINSRRQRWATMVALALIPTVTVTMASASVAMPAGGDTVHSRIKAGYVVGGSPVHTMTAGWVQPAVNCGAAESAASFQIGVGEWSGFTVAVNAICRDGRARYVLGGGLGVSKQSPLTVGSGDHLRVRIRVYPGESTYTFTDVTQGWSVTGSGIGWPNKPQHRAWFLAKRLTDQTGRRLPLAHFGHVDFHICRANNHPLAELDPRRIVMQNRSGATIATPGSIKPAGGFTITQPR